MKRIRVLVAEDSLTIRRRIVEALENDPELEVVGEVADGRQAVELCRALRPDVITLDMMMPEMTGLAATEQIMAELPTPILIVSASVDRGEVFTTYDALAAGAVDVLEKPTGREPMEGWDHQLRLAVKRVSRIKVITHLRGRYARSFTPAPMAAVSPAPTVGRRGLRAVAMGASTGGPAALVEILGRLPENYPLPILLVVHLSLAFARPFAEWLDGHSRVRVRFPRDGERLPTSGVLLATPEQHLVLQQDVVRLVDGPERHSCRPSVDVLFESVAASLGPDAVGCLLTGMGRDGAAGLLAMRRAGATTLAQDEASCVVFGMPREAILLGAASRVLPLERIPGALIDLCRSEGGVR